MKPLLIVLLLVTVVVFAEQTVRTINSQYSPLFVAAPEERPLVMIDYPHHELHEGDFIYATSVDLDVDSSETNTVLLIVPDGMPHLSFSVYSTVAATISLRENIESYSGGTALNVYNAYRFSTNTFTGASAIQNAYIVGGTNIYTNYVGANMPAQKVGGGVRPGTEFILLPNSTNALTVNPVSDNAVVAIEVGGYFHDLR